MQHEERMRREIVERECVLAAFNVLRGYFMNGQGSKSIELTSLALALVREPSHLPLEERTAPASPAIQTEHSPTRYVHPELRALNEQHAGKGEIVSWAIRRMTDDYSVGDITALLNREGYVITSAEISVVLTRLKKRGEIEELRRGKGRKAALFRKLSNGTIVEEEVAGQTEADQRTAELPADT